MSQWFIGAGVIRNIVYDHLDGEATSPIGEVDVAYFDPSDLSGQKERAYEDILKEHMPDIPWEVTHRAAVNLWFDEKFGYRVPAVYGIEEAVATRPETCAAVAVTKDLFLSLGLCGDFFRFIRIGDWKEQNEKS